MSSNYSSHRRIKDMLHSERPQERLEKLGSTALSDSELLAMILRSGPPGIDVVSMSSQLLETAGSLSKLLSWTATDFQQIRGIGKVKALQLIAVMEFAKRILQEGHETETIFDTPETVARHFHTLVAGIEVEKFWILCLNRKNHLIRRFEISSGTATSSLIHPREVFREAIRVAATAIIGVHNHPSGDPTPSRADLQATRQLRDAAKTIGIELLDHIIVGQKNKDPQGNGFYSFQNSGFL